MCVSGPSAPAPTIVNPGQTQSNAAADALQARRKSAQGFDASLGAGAAANTPGTLGRQLLLGGG